MKEKRYCKVCKKEILERRSITFCSRACYDVYNKQNCYVEKVCEYCNKVFKVKKGKRGVFRFCSNECSGLARQKNETRVCKFCKKEFECKAYEKKQFCSLNCANEAQKAPLVYSKCLECGKEFVLEKKDREHFCSHNCYLKHIDAHESRKCKICNGDFEVDGHTRNVQTCSRKCGAALVPIEDRRAQGVKGFKAAMANLGAIEQSYTPIEIKLYAAMDSAGIKYTPQKDLLNITVADAFIEPNIVIYADGMLFHNQPSAKIRDARITNELEQNGFKVLRFTGSEISKNITDCIEKIKFNYGLS